MRFLFIIIVLINIGLFIYGKGLFGTPPADAGRSQSVPAAQNASLTKLGTASSDLQLANPAN